MGCRRWDSPQLRPVQFLLLRISFRLAIRGKRGPYIPDIRQGEIIEKLAYQETSYTDTSVTLLSYLDRAFFLTYQHKRGVVARSHELTIFVTKFQLFDFLDIIKGNAVINTRIHFISANTGCFEWVVPILNSATRIVLVDVDTDLPLEIAVVILTRNIHLVVGNRKALLLLFTRVEGTPGLERLAFTFFRIFNRKKISVYESRSQNRSREIRSLSRRKQEHQGSASNHGQPRQTVGHFVTS